MARHRKGGERERERVCVTKGAKRRGRRVNDNGREEKSMRVVGHLRE